MNKDKDFNDPKVRDQHFAEAIANVEPVSDPRLTTAVMKASLRQLKAETDAEYRRLCESKFRDLIKDITELKYRMLVKNLTPTDLWLGPKEVATLREELDYQYKDGFLLSPDIPLEGGKFVGLTIRLMVNDGIRVGVTFANTNEE
jgi:hypothetical protein